MNTELKIEIIDSLEGFLSLRAEWKELLVKSVDTSIFISWEWQYYWWCHYSGDQKLRLLVVSEKDRIVGILPLYIKRVILFRALTVKLLQFVGTGGDTSPDYLGPILSQDIPYEVARAIVRHIFTSINGWDVLMLSDIQLGSVFHSVMGDVCTAMKQSFTTGNVESIAYIALPDSFDKYLYSLSKKRRKAIRQNQRRFHKALSGRFFIWEEESQLQFAINRLIELHHMRWAGRGNHAFSSTEYIGFHTELMHALIKEGSLRLYCLEADGKIIAMDYCYRWNGEIMVFQGGFDPSYKDLSPGQVLISYEIEHAISERNQGFDLLKGNHDYKRSIAKSTRGTTTITSYQRTFPALIYRSRTEYIPVFKQCIKNKLNTLGEIRFRKLIRDATSD
jgi:CelD/BcsL family acetyltransferase involved in cellulose biosynthesis